jgi:hypothetical protein
MKCAVYNQHRAESSGISRRKKKNGTEAKALRGGRQATAVQ